MALHKARQMEIYKLVPLFQTTSVNRVFRTGIVMQFIRDQGSAKVRAARGAGLKTSGWEFLGSENPMILGRF